MKAEMVCPKCGQEFQDWVKVCLDCGTVLVEKPMVEKPIAEVRKMKWAGVDWFMLFASAGWWLIIKLLSERYKYV